MKGNKIFFVTLILLLLAGCTKEYEAVKDFEEIIVTAIFADNGETRTVLEGASVLWEPGDEIKLFCDGAGSCFTNFGENTSRTAMFSGTLNTISQFSEQKPLFGLYPYRADATADNSTVITTIPSEQTAKADSFEKGMNVCLGRSQSLSMKFYNVCGGIRFSLTRDNIKKVVFEGLANENLAGKVKLAFDGNVPIVSEVITGEKSITLSAPNEGTFEAGRWYYITALPGALSKGFKLTLYTDTLQATYRSDSAVSIKRSCFGSIEEIDSGLEFDTAEESSALYRKWYLGYWVYNSMCIKFNGVESIYIDKDRLTWAGQQDSAGNGDYDFYYDEANQYFTVTRNGMTKVYYIRKMTEDVLVFQEDMNGALRYWYTSVDAAVNASEPDIIINGPNHTETDNIELILTYKYGSTASSLTPMGVYYENGHVTTDGDREWLKNPANEPDYSLANENRYSPSLTQWKEMRVTLYPFGDPIPADVNQHAIGDCSFCSVMSSLSYLYPDFIKHIITDNGDGTFTVAMYDPQGKPVDVSVSSTFLCDSSGTIGQVTGKNYVPTWSTVLEKALMKWETLYMENSLWGIGTEIAAPVLTGDGRSFAFSPNSLWNSEWKLAVEWVLNNGMISVGGFTTGGLQCGTLTTVTAHAFAFMLTADTSGNYLFSMRNPWGITEVDGILEIPDTRRVISTIDMRFVYPGAAAPYLKKNIGPYVPPRFMPFDAESSVSRNILKACRYIE